MDTIKPNINLESTKSFLGDKLKLDFTNLKEVGEGQISRTYSFDIWGKPYFLQFAEQNMSQGSINEILFGRKFYQAGIPLRNIIRDGNFAGLHFTISERVPGIGLTQLPMSEFLSALPTLMDTLLLISNIDISETTGYGWLDANGNGRFDSWRAHLCHVKEEEPGWFYDRWHRLFDTTFLDREIFEYYCSQMERLMDVLPPRRELVHGGFGYNNVLVCNGQVSAVLDWQDARYGDHVFDLAYMINWMDKNTQEACLNIYKNTIEKHNRMENCLEERIKCYQYYIGIDGLRFAARKNDEGFYNAVLDKLSQLDRS